MKPDPIARLLTAARRCPPRPLPDSPPWNFEARTLADWRSLTLTEALPAWTGLLRRALAASMLLAAASACLYLSQPRNSSPNELALTEATLRTHLWP